MVETIKKKRDGLELSKDEIQELIKGLTTGEIPDYQITAFLMALYFQGMTENETAILTECILKSGDQIDLSEISGVKVDKHSTGGVGDKTTLILAPLVAAAGVPVAKMSGRGLGHTGGTIDKLESIKGFNVNLTISEFIEKVKNHNIAICGQNANLVPADKKLYALRDVTATVKNFALITSSIMSKKFACGADAIVIDMKLGAGAYMKTIEEARLLGRKMINTGLRMNRKVIVVISSMNQPLGYTVGNALEVKEAIQTLKGNGPKDLTTLCLELGANMLLLAKRVDTLNEGKNILQELLYNGKAFEKFKEFIVSQNGDINMIEQPDLLPSCIHSKDILSRDTGYVQELDALLIGKASMLLGAGRETKSSKLDLGAGIVLNKKINDKTNNEDLLATIYSNDKSSFTKTESLILQAYKINKDKVNTNSVIIETMK